MMPLIGEWAILDRTESEKHQRFTVDRDGREATCGEVIDAWCADTSFCRLSSDALAGSSFSAFRWETPPVTQQTLDQRFECVLLDAPSLDRPADRDSFAVHFDSDRPVVVFDNLGGDAHLIVPCPAVDDGAYGHFASFVRRAPLEQRVELWRIVGETMRSRLGERPVWLSTAGMGVAWLHLRLDSRPKYYGYTPYRQYPPMESHR